MCRLSRAIVSLGRTAAASPTTPSTHTKAWYRAETNTRLRDFGSYRRLAADLGNPSITNRSATVWRLSNMTSGSRTATLSTSKARLPAYPRAFTTKETTQSKDTKGTRPSTSVWFRRASEGESKDTDQDVKAAMKTSRDLAEERRREEIKKELDEIVRPWCHIW